MTSTRPRISMIYEDLGGLGLIDTVETIYLGILCFY